MISDFAANDSRNKSTKSPTFKEVQSFYLQTEQLELTYYKRTKFPQSIPVSAGIGLAMAGGQVTAAQIYLGLLGLHCYR